MLGILQFYYLLLLLVFIHLPLFFIRLFSRQSTSQYGFSRVAQPAHFVHYIRLLAQFRRRPHPGPSNAPAHRVSSAEMQGAGQFLL